MSRAARFFLSAALAALFALTLASSALAAFGLAPGSVENVALSAPSEVAAEPQAGSHPFANRTSFSFNLMPVPYEPGLHGEVLVEGEEVPDGQAKDAVVRMPPGFVANTSATPKCATSDFMPKGALGSSRCPTTTQIGVATLRLGLIPGASQVATFPVYNLVPRQGEVASIGFVPTAPVVLDIGIRSGGDYGVTATTRDITEMVNFYSSEVSLWGVPSNPSHDAERFLPGGFLPGNEGNPIPSGLPEVAFLRYPTQCADPISTEVSADSWQNPGTFDSQDSPPQSLVGCDRLPFAPSLRVEPTTHDADSPTGLSVDVHLPQDDNPAGTATADLRDAVVSLPRGVSINPASAAGLAACSQEQIELDGPNPASCPDASKIGSVEIESPLIDHPLPGGVYLARQGENKFGSLLAVYLAVNDPETGLVVKLPGKVETDPSGQLTTRFEGTPQLPFEDLRVDFFGGPRASLMTPPSCGMYSATGVFTPWSGGAPVSSDAHFAITRGPGGGACPTGGFQPKLSAGTVNPVAGRFSSFVLSLSREDGSQQLSSLEVSLPPGLLGKLKGVPYCPDPALAAISMAEGSGAGELAKPACPVASQVGTVSVGAGAGSNPLAVDTGRAYLAGPYKGAPVSLVVVTPALAGPFDLGNVVVRTALRIDPVTTRITAVSDQIPAVLHGIPLDLRQVRITLDREGFTLNPTSCDPMSFAGSATSASGAIAPLSDRFQVANCGALGFKPKLAVRFSGAPTHRGGHPALKAVVTMPKGNADIGRAQVTMPKTEFLENAHIRTICTRVEYAADNCPKASVYGFARAWSPLLEKPLEGPVYLRSSNHTLPDLVASLDGQIHVDLAGRISSANRRIRNTFDFVPDAPVSKFVLTMQGGQKGLLVNNTELCRTKPRATADFTGQNGKRSVTHPLVKVACGGKK